MTKTNTSPNLDAVDATAADKVPGIEQGTYEILRSRLEEQTKTLRTRAEALNHERLELFGGAETTVVGTERIRTSNNCVPRDIRTVGDILIFGYNVFVGLRSEVRVSDVLSLHTFGVEEGESGSTFTFEPLADDDSRNFLADPDFRRDFQELYKYYKDARLLHLRRPEGKLLAVFQTGGEGGDVRVLRWSVSPQGEVSYVDNRGERDDVLPPSLGFEWIETNRDDHVLGRHPHVSIRDKVFVETVGGDLTVKVEDNTEDGLGIFREDVVEPHQSLADAKILFAEVGPLILMRILPYNETTWRHLVFNTRTLDVQRIDAIGHACQLLPEDHGIIFPGGYCLQDGTSKTFEGDVEDMALLRTIRSPNGEDVLYVFHERRDGRTILLNYNLIRKEVQNPIHCNGWAIFDDGKLVIFRSVSDEPTRVHTMQIWQTAFVSDVHAAKAPSTGSFLEKIGNAELVRGISDALSLCRVVQDRQPSVEGYEELIATSVRMSDAFYWLDRDEVGDLAEPLGKVRDAADLIVGEFQKVQAIRQQARDAVKESAAAVEALFQRLRSEARDTVDHYVRALADLRTQRGKLITLREMRYVDAERVAELEEELVERFDDMSTQTVEFLLRPEALEPYHRDIETQLERIEDVSKTPELVPITDRLAEIDSGLELLTEVLSALKIEDPTQRTGILEGISEVLSALNRGRALAQARRKELMSVEGRAEFGAQFQLFGQAVSGAIAMADSPEKCDEQLSKLLLQLEELEGRFGEFDDFLEQLATKREDVYEAFSSKKQTLLDERQRKSGRMLQAADRILDGVRRRASALADADALNSYFVGDAMVQKLRELVADLRAMGESVKADELESRLAIAKEEAARSLRDRADIYEAGAEVLKLGRHRFSVNTQAFDLTMVPRAERSGQTAMAYHLTGTDFYQTVDDADFLETRPYWDQLLVSETPQVYRGEFLAASLLFTAEEGREGLSIEGLQQAAREEEGLLGVVRSYASERYDEGYERGLHDHDAALILEALLALYSTAGLLRFAPRPRAMACLFWAFYPEATSRVQWERRSRSLSRLRSAFADSSAIRRLVAEIGEALTAFLGKHGLELSSEETHMAAAYLFEELSRHPVSFATSSEAEALRKAFFQYLDLHDNRRELDEDLRELEDDLEERWHLARAWISAFLEATEEERVRRSSPSLDEAVALILTDRRLDRTPTSALQARTVEGLLGQHPRIRDRALELRLDEYLARLTGFRTTQVPGFRGFQSQRHQLLEEERDVLRLEEFKPKVMSAFVRNRLISDVYLPIIGDNLAKQMGTVGEGKRIDQMGLLLLISPPGYGKTTLMEYIANRLGLVFVKVNGPALGHGVTSLDPSEAPNITARQEVDKINFALEMGNNVLLYLDDIQHTHPELLQKFISLCDAQRRIEGVWNGRTRTYDMKGKRFAVCMAGNPYTESGEAFQIPDMLANRADTYNLGDILEGRGEVFALSYIENSLTSNPVLAPLTSRDPEDVQLLVRMARGDEVQSDQLKHAYSRVELEEILSVLRKLLRIQQVVLAVNQQYIASAAQEDAYRTEPRFQLQGSYRNMNKLSEKVVAVMNEQELESMIDDHYSGEAQTLTTGAEANLLKLGELRGTMTPEEEARWEEIKRGFARLQVMGGNDEDPAVKMLGQLGLVSDRLSDIDRAISTAAATASRHQAPAAETPPPTLAMPDLGNQLAGAFEPYVEHLRSTLETLSNLEVRRAGVGPDAEGRGKKGGKKSGPVSSVPAPAELRLSAELAETLTLGIEGLVDRLVDRLGELVEAGRLPAPAGSSSATSPPASETAPALSTRPIQVDFTPYLEKLDSTLQAVAEAKGTQVVQTLTPGMLELLRELSSTVAENLMPLVQGLDRHMKFVNLDDRKISAHLDRTLKNLDMLEELVGSLRKLDTSSLRRPAQD